MMFGLPELIDAPVRGVVLSLVTLAWILVLARAVGLSTLSKMTAIDFVVTLSTASLLSNAATVTRWSDFVQAVSAIAAVLAGQALYATLRRRSDRFRRLAENQPVMLVRDGRFVDAAMRRCRVAEADIHAKLRLAGVTDLSEVRALVMEVTGDTSVICGTLPNDRLLDGVDCSAGGGR